MASESELEHGNCCKGKGQAEMMGASVGSLWRNKETAEVDYVLLLVETGLTRLSLRAVVLPFSGYLVPAVVEFDIAFLLKQNGSFRHEGARKTDFSFNTTLLRISDLPLFCTKIIIETARLFKIVCASGIYLSIDLSCIGILIGPVS